MKYRATPGHSYPPLSPRPSGAPAARAPLPPPVAIRRATLQRHVQLQPVFGDPSPLTNTKARAWVRQSGKSISLTQELALDAFLAASNKVYGVFRQDAFLEDLDTYAQERRVTSFNQRTTLGKEACIAMSLFWLHRKVQRLSGPLSDAAVGAKNNILGWQKSLDDDAIKLAKNDDEALKGAGLMPKNDYIGIETIGSNVRLGEGRRIFEQAMSRIRAGQLALIADPLGFIVLTNAFMPNIVSPDKYRESLADVAFHLKNPAILAISGPSGGHAIACLPGNFGMRYFDPEFGEFAPGPGNQGWLAGHLESRMPLFTTHATFYILKAK